MKLLNFPQNYQVDRYRKLRSNQDQHTNVYGQKLIELSISSKMKILNGRILGDLMGKFTYIGYNGISTVDYVLGSENFLMQDYIYSFQVEELTYLSDHRPISLTLKFNKRKEKENIQKIPVSNKLRKKKITLNNYENYKIELNRQMNTNYIGSLIKQLDNIKNTNDICSLDNLTQNITELYIKCLGNSYKQYIKPNYTERKQKTLKNPWYMKDCKILKSR